METLAQQVARQPWAGGEVGGELVELLGRVAQAGKVFAREVRRAALSGKLGVTGAVNVQGEATKRLDVLGNEVVIDTFAPSGLVAAIVSEEDDDVRRVADGPRARWLLCVDPVDGSSNTDIAGSVGTIFGLYRATDTRPVGRDQAAAGYVLYGTSTVLVYTAGAGTHGFTLDEDAGEFRLTHPALRCPERGKYYACNQGNAPRWDAGPRRYVAHLAESDRATGRPYGLRYTGALVADVHRMLLDGGVYLYPADDKHRGGKLRLLYECAPLALVVEQAGGAASTGRERMLDVRATSIHQRVPLAIGSRADVQTFERFEREAQQESP